MKIKQTAIATKIDVKYLIVNQILWFYLETKNIILFTHPSPLKKDECKYSRLSPYGHLTNQATLSIQDSSYSPKWIDC